MILKEDFLWRFIPDCRFRPAAVSAQKYSRSTRRRELRLYSSGTGVRAYNRLHPDNPESETSTYKHIRFLGVDIDPTNTGRKAACQKRDKRTD